MLDEVCVVARAGCGRAPRGGARHCIVMGVQCWAGLGWTRVRLWECVMGSGWLWLGGLRPWGEALAEALLELGGVEGERRGGGSEIEDLEMS